MHKGNTKNKSIGIILFDTRFKDISTETNGKPL